tara:strand:- start:267 stop:1142 length:876 start_codon:yes stop_codon:yes gene_type:complete
MDAQLSFLNGRWIPLHKARISVLDRGFMLGDGLFETLRAYNGKIFRQELHLDRLWTGASAIGIELPWSRKKIGDLLNLAIKKNSLCSAYIRLTVTRGEGFINPSKYFTGSPNVSIITRPWPKLPKSFYLNGVGVIVFPETAQSTADIKIRVKTCNFLSATLLKKRASEMGAFEAILLRGNSKLTEGAFSNLFIIKDHIVKTPQLNQWVLAGITRSVVLEIGIKSGIPCYETSLNKEDLFSADEVFLTNTGYEVLPVTYANGIKIGTGKPGPLTRKLHRAFLKIVEEETHSC